VCQICRFSVPTVRRIFRTRPEITGKYRTAKALNRGFQVIKPEETGRLSKGKANKGLTRV
jgi:hypothetical protein